MGAAGETLQVPPLLQPVPDGEGRPEQRDGRCPDGRGDADRAGVAPDDHAAPLPERGEPRRQPPQVGRWEHRHAADLVLPHHGDLPAVRPQHLRELGPPRAWPALHRHPGARNEEHGAVGQGRDARPAGRALVVAEDHPGWAHHRCDHALAREDPLVALADELVGRRRAPQVGHRAGAAGGGVVVDEVADAVEAGGGDDEVGRQLGQRLLDGGPLRVGLGEPDRGHRRVPVQEHGAGGVGEHDELARRVGLVERVHRRQHHHEVAEPAEQVDDEGPHRATPV